MVLKQTLFITWISMALGIVFMPGCRKQKPKRQVVYIYSHGIAETHKEVYKFTSDNKESLNSDAKKRFIISQPFYSFNYPDATERFWRINFWKSNLGQQNDVESLASEYQKVISQHPNADVVIVGLSRGAAAAFNFCALKRPSQVKALILESPFDSINHLMQSHAKRFKIPLTEQWCKKLPSILFRDYQHTGIQPIDMVKNFPRDIPLLIICSKEDTVVPCDSSVSLYNSLIQVGHQQSEILLLEQGKHGFLFVGPQGDTYAQAVHAFYQKHHLT